MAEPTVSPMTSGGLTPLPPNEWLYLAALDRFHHHDGGIRTPVVHTVYGNTLIVYALSNIEWKPLRFASTPNPMGRSGHSATVLKNMMYIYGGNTHGSTLNDFWQFNLGDLSTGAVRC